MDLSRSILKEFADVTNKETVVKENYLRGTAKVMGNKKYVQIDGSSMITPISETVDVQDGDRVLVTIENHKATILGNFTFPPNARTEQEALDKANDAQTESNIASEKAQEAYDKAVDAAFDSSAASASAEEAKQSAQEALQAAGNASQSAEEAKQAATDASNDAFTAKEEAAKAQASVANANAEINKINESVEGVKSDINGALTELGELSAETATIKETMEVSYAKKDEVSNVEANLKTEISKSVGELQTNIEQNYAGKNEVAQIQGSLQTQITQNAEGLKTQASKTEKLEADTAAAQEQVNDALEKANNAQLAASQAQTNATAAQAAADEAKLQAQTAQDKATDAQNKADQANQLAQSADQAVQAAQGDLAEAKANLSSVTSRVDATEEEIAAAQAAVDAAQEQVNQALADAAEATYAADQATQAAEQAKVDASQAQTAATDAQNKADAAQVVANNAKGAADKAQQEVAALTSRVTSAETAIKQNAEAIELAASKTEEIGDLLQNNYYTKTETDAKIKVESDRITSTVTTVETVKKNAITSSIEEFYLSTSPTALSGGSWSTTQPTWTQGKYIWRRTKNTKGDGTTSYTPNQNGVCITGNTGATGSPGAAGVGIKSTSVTYQGSTSGTTPPTGTWSTSIPTVSAGSYLWTRTIITYSNDTSSTFYSVGKMGTNGSPGEAGSPGSDGKSVSSITVEFYLSTSKTTQTGGAWSTTLPTWSTGKYLWTRQKIVYTNPSSTSYTTPICDSSWEAVNEIEVGGRNLVLNSGTEVTNGNYNIGSYWLSPYSSDKVGKTDHPILVEGDTYTISVKAKIASGTNITKFCAYWSGYVWFAEWTPVFDENHIYTKTFVANHTSGDSTVHDQLSFYVFPSSATRGESTIYWVKIEKGTKATDWTPAPEDIDEGIANAQDVADQANDAVIDVDTRVTEAESTIEQLSNMIANLVTDENGGSLMTQTSDGWTFNMSSITNNLETIKNEMASMEDDHSATNDALGKLTDLVNDVANKTAYITIATDNNGDPCIELGKTDNLFKVRITNTAIDFLEGSTRIAYANNNTFYATKLIARDGIQIGSGPAYEWRTRSNGNLGLVYVSN